MAVTKRYVAGIVKSKMADARQKAAELIAEEEAVVVDGS